MLTQDQRAELLGFPELAGKGKQLDQLVKALGPHVEALRTSLSRPCLSPAVAGRKLKPAISRADELQARLAQAGGTVPYRLAFMLKEQGIEFADLWSAGKMLQKALEMLPEAIEREIAAPRSKRRIQTFMAENFIGDAAVLWKQEFGAYPASFEGRKDEVGFKGSPFHHLMTILLHLAGYPAKDPKHLIAKARKTLNY